MTSLTWLSDSAWQWQGPYRLSRSPNHSSLRYTPVACHCAPQTRWSARPKWRPQLRVRPAWKRRTNRPPWFAPFRGRSLSRSRPKCGVFCPTKRTPLLCLSDSGWKWDSTEVKIAFCVAQKVKIGTYDGAFVSAEDFKQKSGFYGPQEYFEDVLAAGGDKLAASVDGNAG